MSNQPLVSIICPTLNVEAFIAQHIESVQAQTYKNWELILMDGISSDSTLSIIQKYSSSDPRIKVYSEPDEGPLHATEKGLALAGGEYLVLVGGQDFFRDNNWLSEAVDTLNNDKDISLVWSLGLGINEEGEEIPTNTAYAHLIEGRSRSEAFLVFIKKFLTVTRDLFLASWQRKQILVKKIFSKSAPLRLNSITALGFEKDKFPQKEDWFFYWLKTGLVFPDQSLVVSKKIFMECSPHYEIGSKRINSFADFVFNFNTRGYLAYFIPTYSICGRLHYNNSGSRAGKEIELETQNYLNKLRNFKSQNLGKKIYFRDRNGSVISEREVS